MQSALNRARQYKYTDVAAKAEKILSELRSSPKASAKKLPLSPRLSPSMSAAGRIEPERKVEDYSVVRRNVRRAAILGSPTRYEWDGKRGHGKHYDHEGRRHGWDHEGRRHGWDHEGRHHGWEHEGRHYDWDHHKDFMMRRYNWDDKKWNEYSHTLKNYNWENSDSMKGHKDHMKHYYGFDDKDWKDYRHHMKSYNYDHDRKYGKEHQGVRMSPSMSRYGKNKDEDCGCSQ